MKKLNNGKIIKIIFYFLIILSFFMAFNSIKIFKNYFRIMEFYYPLKPISINLTFKNKQSDDFFLCFNDVCEKPSSLQNQTDNSPDTYSSIYNPFNPDFYKGKINNIRLLYPDNENFIKNIERIDIYIDDDRYHYNQDDILKLKNEKVNLNSQISKNNFKGDYIARYFDTKDNSSSKTIVYSIIFLSLFYNFKFFIPTYILLFIASLIFLYRKDVIPDKIKNISYKWYLGASILIGIILRLVIINYRTLWSDEIYTKEVAVNSFKSCFLDPGNPPLFFILEFIIKKLGFTSDFSLRFLSFVFGILFIHVVFLLFKKIDKKLALFACFFASINLISITYSNIARVYSLCIFLGTFSIYLLFKYLKNPEKKKNLWYYSLSAICLINSHYICTIFVLSNFFFGIFKLFKKNKKEILRFISLNFIAFLTFVPYFLMTFKTSLNSTFNSWIKPLCKETIINELIVPFFQNKTNFLLFILLIFITFICSILTEKIRKKLYVNELKRELFIYSFYSLSFVALVIILIDIFIKPIYCLQVNIAIYSLIFIVEILLIATIFDFDRINSKPLISIKTLYSIIVALFILSITNLNIQLRTVHRYDDFIDFINVDLKKYDDSYLIFALFSNDTNLNYYPKIDKRVQIFYTHLNEGKNLSYISETDKKYIVYWTYLSVDINNDRFIKNPKNKILITNWNLMGKFVND